MTSTLLVLFAASAGGLPPAPPPPQAPPVIDVLPAERLVWVLVTDGWGRSYWRLVRESPPQVMPPPGRVVPGTTTTGC